MNWAQEAIVLLQNGSEAVINPRGHSMKGKIKSGATVTVAPTTEYKVGDIVLVKVKGRIYLHLIKEIEKNRYLIGNNVGGINGWVGQHALYGIVIKIED